VSLAEPTRRRCAGPGECPSVALALLSDEHIDALLPLADHPAIHRASSVPSPCTQDWFAERLDDMRGNRPTALHFCVMADGTPAGMTSLKKLDYVASSGELSFWIGLPYQDRGIASAAARLMVENGFGELKLRRIDAHALLKANPASSAMLLKLGFAPRPDLDIPAEGRFQLVPADIWRFYELPRP
jgi:[ribosomal protein S5]-alanine N-acetyltransferase